MNFNDDDLFAIYNTWWDEVVAELKDCNKELQNEKNDQLVSSVLEAQRVALRAAALAIMSYWAGDAPVRPKTVEFFGGSTPMEANGRTNTGLLWTWRLRYNKSFLEVGEQDEEYTDLVKNPRLCANVANVMVNQHFLGELPLGDAAKLIGLMFKDLHIPSKGETFGERLSESIKKLTALLDAEDVVVTFPDYPKEQENEV